MVSDRESEPGTDNQDEPRPDHGASTTVGTGSALGVGCIAAVILLVLLALAVRWLAGGW